jgi:hypothetical protein
MIPSNFNTKIMIHAQKLNENEKAIGNSMPKNIKSLITINPTTFVKDNKYDLKILPSN